eukprot:GAHX01002106.1.p3 GENE.GAHX01002106.1~~GAHX01002106.1.p3  ORF type:complete len:54 (-),score=3.39 GAHX01002106.1:568-729(-)
MVIFIISSTEDVSAEYITTGLLQTKGLNCPPVTFKWKELIYTGTHIADISIQQ